MYNVFNNGDVIWIMFLNSLDLSEKLMPMK